MINEKSDLQNFHVETQDHSRQTRSVVVRFQLPERGDRRADGNHDVSIGVSAERINGGPWLPAFISLEPLALQGHLTAKNWPTRAEKTP